MKKDNVQVSFAIPSSLYVEYEDLFKIMRRKRKGKLLKQDFILEVIKKGVRQWFIK
jgi:DNA polymerase III alpha subunit (gram-positive type)